MTHTTTHPSTSIGWRDLPSRRRAHILDLVTTTGQARVGELAAAFQVSTETIRRDIRTLAAAGALTAVHGGALAATQTPLADPPTVARGDYPDGSPALPERRGGNAGLPHRTTPTLHERRRQDEP